MKLVKLSGHEAGKAERYMRQLENRGAGALERVMPAVQHIVQDVRRRGDKALRHYRAKFDGVAPKEAMRIPPETLRRAWETTPPAMQRALELAATNIADFAYRQMPMEWSLHPAEGVTTGQRVRPLASVGCYVPSGRHPLPSTLLMTAIPAHVAGVRQIVVVSPRPAREMLAAASLLGISQVYQVGGAHAVAALAYGTASVPRVDKIVGPGNLYVTAAKRAVAFDCGIDMLAGPTEIVVASETGDPAWIAADLVAQAEHDPEALAVLITTNMRLAKQVIAETKRQARGNVIAEEALRQHGVVFVADSVANVRSLINRLAPEHLTVDSEEDLAWVENAGSVFVGNWSAQPLGDYISGPNHTLPTGGMARLRGGLSVLDFVKLITVQNYTREGVARLGPAAIRLAEAEGLTAHAEAIRRRSADA